MRLYKLLGRGWRGGGGASTYPCAKHVVNKGGPGVYFPRKF